MDGLQFIDFVKCTTLIALVSNDELMDQLVLKGGNALDLIYGISTRASMDLDFSVPSDLGSPEALQAKIETLLTSTFAERDLVPFDVLVEDVPPHLSEDLKHFWGGYNVEFKLIATDQHVKYRGDKEALRRHSKAIGPNGSPKFKIDISRHETCEGRVPKEIDNYRIFVYSPEMIVAEKLWAICQQMPEYGPVVKRTRPTAPRAKDFVDIHNVCARFSIDFSTETVGDLIRRTFRKKQVPLPLLPRIMDYREFHSHGFQAVKDTVKPGIELLEFDAYFDFVISVCDDLKPLWNE